MLLFHNKLTLTHPGRHPPILTPETEGSSRGGLQGADTSGQGQGEEDAKRRRSVESASGAGGGGGSARRGGGGRGGGGGGAGRGAFLLDEELHVYIAAMQLFPIKLNFSFIKNADVKVENQREVTCAGFCFIVDSL